MSPGLTAEDWKLAGEAAAPGADRLALGLYQAMLDGVGMLPALRDVARSIGATSHAVHTIRFRNGRPVESTSASEGGVTPAAMAEYARFWVRHDPYAKVIAGLPPGVHDLGHFVPPETMERSSLWQEWGRPNGAGFHAIAVPLRRDLDWVGGVYFQRRPEIGPFPAAAAQLLEALFPHLDRVFAAQARLGPAFEVPAPALGMAFDALPDGVVLLDAARRMVFANAALRRMAAAADGFTLGPFGIEVTQAKVRLALSRAVTAALAAVDGQVGLLPAAGSLSLPRPSRRSPWLVRALPLSQGGRDGGAVLPGFRGAMLLVIDGDRRAGPGAALLGRLFGLTPAEAALAGALATGRSIEEHAKRRGVSRETVRSHLAAIRRKTGCRRQAELALLFSRLPG